MKKTLLIIIALTISGSLFSCAEKEMRNDVTPREVADKIKTALPLPDGYGEHGGDYIAYRFEGIDGISESGVVIYSNDTRRADLVAIFHIDDMQKRADALKICNSFIVDQRELFSSVVEQYLPSEAGKLECAEARRFGNYIVVCILDPQDAKLAFEVAEALLSYAQSP